MVSNIGATAVYEKDGGAWLRDASHPFDGVAAGSMLRVASGRTNFDPATMTGPAHDNVLPTLPSELPNAVPDCDADCGQPKDGLVNVSDLLEVLDRMLDRTGVTVAIGEEIEDPALRRCALVARRYGTGPGDTALGVLGVIGPSRMDFSRVIPLVDYLSEVVTGKLSA